MLLFLILCSTNEEHGGYAFRSDGRYFVLAERHKSKDTVGVYDTADSYKLVRVGIFISRPKSFSSFGQHFPLPTSSLASLALSPTGNHLAIWEGPIEVQFLSSFIRTTDTWPV